MSTQSYDGYRMGIKNLNPMGMDIEIINSDGDEESRSDQNPTHCHP